MGPPRREFASEVTLPDGRTLAYAEYGDAEGSPVLFFHGTPGSRVSASVAREAMTRAGVRLVAPERPGFGRSEFTSDRTFADWADDVAALTDALGIDEYGVVGVAGGGPYALACAAHTPERVTRCAVVSGFAPPGVASGELGRLDRTLFSLAKWSPHLGRPLAWLLCRRIRDADRFTDVVGDPRDGDLSDPRFGETGRILLSDRREAVRQGPLPLAADYGVLARPWDFELLDVDAPTRVFHGDADETVPLAAGEHVASHVPGAELVVYGGEGHVRPAVEHAGDVYGWAAGVDEDGGRRTRKRGAADD
ncbi:alpha/beta fold hydrolase [Halobacterium wangiae]|uniref:alpha/beta fold hydrolase n=1 Tax=Halobacterium wangiae TaxID=2902623 RepID=UPI001E4412E8|nr:alpha/beta hydrolase [Halobacterium wangiae]